MKLGKNASPYVDTQSLKDDLLLSDEELSCCLTL